MRTSKLEKESDEDKDEREADRGGRADRGGGGKGGKEDGRKQSIARIYRFVVSTHRSAMPGTQASSPSTHTLLSIDEEEGDRSIGRRRRVGGKEGRPTQASRRARCSQGTKKREKAADPPEEKRE